ncbi:M4 family metallopeptidase (plasmid) [Nostoc sp. UHCC 0302]|uniref:M4 family metallopeptidase n=1 Tax=Nostoc sp. UHCC 0302 TaxID=3134896 RepID=UPI00311CB232
MNQTCRCLSCITPPHLLKKLLESKDENVRKAALNTLLTTSQLRGERTVRASASFLATPASGRRSIYNCQNSYILSSAVLARREDDMDPVPDESVNLAFEGLGTTREFYKEVLNRNSLNGRGMRLDGFVHHGIRYNNAFWDGQQMVFGDGDDIIFTDFTKSLDVIAHELTHGVTEFTANLEYHTQSGALNESISDVFGSLVKQWSLRQTADEADWLIGSEIFTPHIGADALRSMKAPGTAYDNSQLGKDPQPDHMDRFVVLPDTQEGDWGGVHINSGIPNKAFYLTAVNIGGNAWEDPGSIWYESLLASNQLTQFQDFANTTYMKAGQMYGPNSIQQQAVASAWRQVGIRIAGARSWGPSKGRNGTADGDSLVALTKQIESLASQVKTLTK